MWFLMPLECGTRSMCGRKDRTSQYLYPTVILHSLLSVLISAIPYGLKDPELKPKFIKPLADHIEIRFMQNNDFPEIDAIGLAHFFKVTAAFFNEVNKDVKGFRKHVSHYMCEYYLNSRDPAAQIKGIHKLKDKLGIAAYCNFACHT